MEEASHGLNCLSIIRLDIYTTTSTHVEGKIHLHVPLGTQDGSWVESNSELKSLRVWSPRKGAHFLSQVHAEAGTC